MDTVNDFLVDPGAQDHLDHIHGVFVGHPHAVHKFGFDVEAIQ